jgi:cyclophilin family peptidyl-prolyl cis-trans isomerase
MLHRLSLALVVVTVCSFVVAPFAGAQVVRFETTVGNFDMVLNPTDNPVLEGHVENMLHYIENNSYKSSWINRAAEDFVLQMGGFYSHTKRVPIDITNTRGVATVAPIEGEPAAENPGLSNTRGTVALALPGLAGGGTNQNGGTSSFFVNLGGNEFLDADFTVFAAIPDMTTIDKIMGLTQIDLTALPNFGAGSGNLGFSDVPLESNGFQVFIRRAYQITDTLEIARAEAGVQSIMAASLAGGGNGEAALASPLVSSVVPEPATALLAVYSAASLALLRRRY